MPPPPPPPPPVPVAASSPAFAITTVGATRAAALQQNQHNHGHASPPPGASSGTYADTSPLSTAPARRPSATMLIRSPAHAALADTFSPAWIPPLLAYCAASIAMTVTNKLVLSSFPFRLVFLVLAVQSLASVALLEVAAVAARLLRGPTTTAFQFRRPDRATTRHWLTVAAAMAAMLYTGGRAIAALPIAVFTIFKNLTIIAIAYAEIWTNPAANAHVTRPMLAAFAIMVLSSVVAARADTATTTDPWGYAWVAANCVASAIYVLHMRKSIQTLGLKDLDTVYLNNLLTTPLFLALSHIADPWSVLADPAHAVHVGPFFKSALVSGFAAFGISFASAWAMRVVNATTYSMVGALNKLPISVAGLVFLGEPATPGSISSILLGFAAGMLYSKAKRDHDRDRAQSIKPGDLPLPLATHNRPKLAFGLARSNAPINLAAGTPGAASSSSSTKMH
ncbi:UDP-galactose transporter [Allomyces macrogynus ATCC 38327]|uniref:GDP-mannose transporter n=1 Tax=Allomyces macrogynus (strain ATCC 38327) TaxID=578462 RepID=A0A0L0SKX3_ALLM3|nr:UDP-galactose transporter [Allomyces macrogynus ATCC 38327]|eukprot:KNE63029.1 UDP-galactose transporter [Allomyces macrogynus ATCC 38327]